MNDQLYINRLPVRKKGQPEAAVGDKDPGKAFLYILKRSTYSRPNPRV